MVDMTLESKLMVKYIILELLLYFLIEGIHIWHSDYCLWCVDDTKELKVKIKYT